MGGKHNKCCCAACEITADDFNRANANPPSGDWLEVSGEWEISGNQLQSVSAGILVTTLRQSAPVRVGAGYNTRFFVDFVIPASGNATYQVITAYRSSSDYNWINFDYNGTTGVMTPTFYSTAGTGSPVMSTTLHPAGELWSPTPGTNFRMVFCNAMGEWSCTHDGDQGDVIWHTCTAGGLAALPTSPAGGVGFLQGKFDNFAYYIHWESDLTCERCQCLCLNPADDDDFGCIPEELTLTVVQDGGSAFDCPCVDGLTLTLYQSTPDVSGSSPVFNKASRKNLWYSDTFECNGEKMWFILGCTAGTTAVLSIVTYPTTSQAYSAFHLMLPNQLHPRTEGSSTCSPYSQVFEGLHTFATTCDILDEFGTPIGTGEVPAVCTDCSGASPTPLPTWTVYVTE